MPKSVFHKVLARAPTTASALGGLAVAKRKLGDSDEALELIKKANTVDPNNGWIKLEYANLLRDAGRTDEAVSMLEFVDRTSAMYAKALIMLGQTARAGAICIEQWIISNKRPEPSLIRQRPCARL